MADFIRSLDSNTRAFLTIFIVAILSNLLREWWARFKRRQESVPITMKLRSGVYVPWGPVQRIEAAGRIGLKIGVAYWAVLVVLLIYMKAMGWSRLF